MLTSQLIYLLRLTTPLTSIETMVMATMGMIIMTTAVVVRSALNQP